MGDSKVHPIDVSTLNKGDVISVEQIEEIAGVKRDDPEFWHASLQLGAFIESASRKAGRPLLVRSDHDAIRIMMDNEASKVTHARMVQGQAQILRNMGRREIAINVALLTDAERAEHERASCNWGAKTAALVSAGQAPRRVVGGIPQLPDGNGKP